MLKKAIVVCILILVVVGFAGIVSAKGGVGHGGGHAGGHAGGGHVGGFGGAKVGTSIKPSFGTTVLKSSPAVVKSGSSIIKPSSFDSGSTVSRSSGSSFPMWLPFIGGSNNGDINKKDLEAIEHPDLSQKSPSSPMIPILAVVGCCALFFVMRRE